MGFSGSFRCNKHHQSWVLLHSTAFPSYSFLPLFFVYSISWHCPLTADVELEAFPSVVFHTWYSISHAPPRVPTMPSGEGINVGSGSLQQPEGLFLFHALGTLCQPLNTVSLVGFVETACAQRWFSCKLIAAPRVKRAWAVCRQPVRTPPAHDISIARWGPGAAPVSPCCFFFVCFVLVFKEREESLGKEQKMPAFSGELLNALHCNTTTNNNKNVIDVL